MTILFLFNLWLSWFLVWWVIVKFYPGHYGCYIKSLSFLGLAQRLLLCAVVIMTFNIQSCYNAILVCLVCLVSWCYLRRREEFLQAGFPDTSRSRKGVSGPWEGHRWRGLPGSGAFVAGSHLHCVWVREWVGNLRPAGVGEHLSWTVFASGASDLSLLPVLPYLVLSYSGLRSNEPTWAAFCCCELWVGKCQDWVTFFYWTGQFCDAGHAENLWTQGL